MKELIILIKHLCELVRCKVVEIHKKQEQEWQAKQKAIIDAQAQEIKAILKPHLIEILNGDVHFSGENRINFLYHYYDSLNRKWMFKIKVKATDGLDMESHKLLRDLNNGAKEYWTNYILAMKDEVEQVKAKMCLENRTSGEAVSAQNQIAQKYRLLNYSLVFDSITYVPDSKKRFVEICFTCYSSY